MSVVVCLYVGVCVWVCGCVLCLIVSIVLVCVFLRASNLDVDRGLVTTFFTLSFLLRASNLDVDRGLVRISVH